MRCDSDSRTFWKRQNHGDKRKIGGRLGSGEGGRGVDVQRRGVLRPWNCPVGCYKGGYVTVTKTHTVHTTQRLQCITTPQCWLIGCSGWTTLAEDVC